MMGSLYIMISVPSKECEKSIWIEQNLKQNGKRSESIRPNRSEGNMCFDEKTGEGWVLVRSISDDSVLEKISGSGTPEMKERTHSAIYMSRNKNTIPLETRLKNCLKELNIPNAVWVLGQAGKYYQVSFCTPAGEQCEKIIQLLTEHEIGVKYNSSVSILPCSLYYGGKEHTRTSDNRATPPKPCLGVKEVTAWEQFVHSVRDRLMVAQVVEVVKNNAVFTFDFLILLIIASITATVGLVENSVVILVASMLISPLMGPVMASTFGFVTKDWKLQKIGALNELLGLLLCVIIGFLCGLIIAYLDWENPDVVWPTPEMLTRGDVRSLCVGALIALLSGTAVAIAVLGNYSGSIIGVAISASLMPPAVNAGLLWALAVIILALGDTNPRKLNALATGDPVRELVVLGALSLALTFINIVCIFLTGIMVLKIKEVAPRGSKYTHLLWQETMQMARDYKYMPQNTEGMEQDAHVNDLTNLLTQSPYAKHQHTWGAFEAMKELNRLSSHNLTTLHQLTLHPDMRRQMWQGRGLAAGTPIAKCKLSKMWSLQTPVAPTCSTVDECSHSLGSSGAPESIASGSRKFTVTPTQIEPPF